ncbi:hypothetical protein ACROYT_G019355 [Oculina patagonica]
MVNYKKKVGKKTKTASNSSKKEKRAVSSTPPSTVSDHDRIPVVTSLPPSVDGHLRCFLRVSVPTINWTIHRYPADVQVRLKWWGEDGDGVLFRPLDDKADDQTRDFPKLTCVRYAVCSGPRQFNAYLKGEYKPCSVLYCGDYSAQYMQQMAAARYSSEVLQAKMEENLREFQRNPQRNLSFSLAHTDFNEWLRVWKMDIPETDTNNKDLLIFAKKHKKKFYDLLESEIDDLRSLKASFGLEVKFSIQRDGVTQHMNHYFSEREPHVFSKNTKEEIEKEFVRFIEKAKGEIEAWSEKGSGWKIERIEMAYINVARYQPLRGGSYLPLPPKLANKKAVINVQNRDNECLKWALRAALFPPRDGKNPQRTSRYPVDDGINYNGIDFPTPLKQIDRLEAQNNNLAINVFGWEDDCVIPLRTSKKENSISRINLMLIESGLIQHYCFVKRVCALLYDQTKSHNKKHFCMMCLTGFTRADLLEKHEKYCNGVNGRPTRIEMPEEGKNTISFKNYHKQMKAPFVIYADFEALLRKMQGCKRETAEERQKRKDLGEEVKDMKPSYTDKTEQHEACGFAYTVVRSDGEHEKTFVYRGQNAVEVFLNCLLSEERKIRYELSKPKPLVMTAKDWVNFKNATNCHICEETLMKQNFLDSLPVWIGNKKELNYFGQMHKKCYYRKEKEEKNLDTETHYKLKKLEKETHKLAAKNQKNCLACHKPLIQPNYKDVVKDHCHITGKFRGAAHNICNFMMRIDPKKVQIPVAFHNLRGYDEHHLMQAMSKISKEAQKEVKCVANNMEKYITFSLGGLRFIDSLNFLPGKLEKLVEEIPKESLNITKDNLEFEESEECFELLCKKGIYPYEYMDSWGRFKETSLPEKEKFYSKLNDEHITDKEYEHAQKVWKTFGCQTLGDYHDLYVKTDVTLLADVFESFRKLGLEKYGLDPANYYTTPGLSWDALLKKTGVELELLTDYEMHLFVERGIRGGISMVSKRYAKANNPYVEGFDPSQPKIYITYLDANNLYGWAMSKPLPKSGFRWKKVMPTEKEITTKKEYAKAGWILEVDLEYPKELHDAHNSYPLAPEKKKINKEMFSPYQNKTIKNLDLHPPDTEKLVLTLEDKTNYVVHYRNLQFYLKQGMKLKKVHRVLEFEQEAWMEPYIRMNTEFRKEAKSDFEKNFYKLMNNSVFGKTMENLRNRVDIRIVRSDETKKIRKLVASPLYSRHVMFSNDLVGIAMRKSKLFLNKPVYTGMTILDVSKLCMYDFYYNHLKKEYGERCELLYTDTDSLLLEIETEDVYADMAENIDKYDTSDYPKDHSLFSTKNKKVLGKMKDECAGKLISECVCLRPKMYSIMTEDKKNIKKAKGVKECVTKNKIDHENFKDTLFQNKESFHEMHMLRSYAHEMYSIVVNKKSLSPFDSKRWIADDGIHTNAYGYKFCETKPT